MGLKFANEEKKQLRLHNTVCVYDGEPVYVSTRPPSYGDTPLQPNEVYIKYLIPSAKVEKPAGATSLGAVIAKAKGSWFKVDYTLDAFKYFGIELGYMNHSGFPYYLSRDPAREQQAGLSPSNVSFPVGLDKFYLTSTAEFGRCVRGDHPSFEEAVKAVEELDDGDGVAFDRNLALIKLDSKRLMLEHKGKSVGIKGAKSNGVFTMFGSKSLRSFSDLLNKHGVQYRIDDNL